jgi:protein-L-isoaspartate(D-aspartate) O-methyltransferase
MLRAPGAQGPATAMAPYAKVGSGPLDLQAARIAMVDSQVRPNDVTDRHLIAAMAAIPREVFLPVDRQVFAYADAPAETVPGRWMAAARDFSKLVNAAAIVETDRILDIAPGTGYSTAVLARLGASIVALEQDEANAKALREGLSRAGVSGVDILVGALKAGAPSKAPFDVIHVNGAIEDVPKAWLDQLADGGRLVAVVAEGGIRRARVHTRSGGKTAWRAPFDAAIPILPGFERAAEFRF